LNFSLHIKFESPDVLLEQLDSYAFELIWYHFKPCLLWFCLHDSWYAIILFFFEMLLEVRSIVEVDVDALNILHKFGLIFMRFDLWRVIFDHDCTALLI
jgi:hypothetical protein